MLVFLLFPSLSKSLKHIEAVGEGKNDVGHAT